MFEKFINDWIKYNNANQQDIKRNLEKGLLNSAKLIDVKLNLPAEEETEAKGEAPAKTKIELIQTATSVELVNFIKGADSRVTVVKAATDRIKELEKA